MNIEPIGVVKSPVKEPIDENWQEVIAEIHLHDSLAPGLKGLDRFSHLVVVFFMHQYSFAPVSDLVRRPQERADMPEVGIFAQRAKHRPNPIGITAVELIEVRGPVLVVKGLDAIDGTPVLDIKPYVPAFDSRPTAVVPRWIERLMENYF
ncbi:MAG TPA: tRNA (N6-threonylcarbamoyladenosine(37)-N6)-methyltransferase TrmO [Candidatus Binatia bacterium]|nr:tRNA (N6-threonylcarbamoyladenosine(37)-N6)-methyltransferase TrmO [Candidatus Binatia bacterium]